MMDLLVGRAASIVGMLLATGCGRIAFDRTQDAAADTDVDLDAIRDAPLVDASLIVWYPMDDDPSDGAIDASGHGRIGACGANGCPLATAGRVGGAYAFTPSVYLRLVHDSGLDALPAFTVAVWMRVNAVTGPGYSALARTVGSTVENSWDLGTFSSNVPSFCSSADGNSNSCDLAPQPAPVAAWFHLAGTWDGAIKRIYVDGVMTSFGTRSIIFDAHDVTVGCDDENGSLFACLDGALDDVRIYNRALSAADVAVLAQQ